MNELKKELKKELAFLYVTCVSMWLKISILLNKPDSVSA